MSFGEKDREKNKKGSMVEVIKLPKYNQSKEKAFALLEKYEDVKEGDFWILKNETKDGRIMYSGLIISHNACLKINDHLAPNDRFVPSCVELDKVGYNGSLVFTYCNDAQGIYEVGEVSPANCKNAYPYAMAYKRLFDRVVLKNSKIAYDGIYSGSEADEFREPLPDTADEIPEEDIEKIRNELATKMDKKTLLKVIQDKGKKFEDVEALKALKDPMDWREMTFGIYDDAMKELGAE